MFLDRERIRPPRLYSYIVATGKGFTPCVSKDLLTLACCKPKIRSTAKPGDWIMGTTPRRKGSGKLVFLAKVGEKVTFSEYYNRVSKTWRDNSYWRRRTGGYIQASTCDHEPEQKKKDLSAGAVLMSKTGDFVYYGGSADQIPRQFVHFVAIARGYRKIEAAGQISEFFAWLDSDLGESGESLRTKNMLISQ